MDLIYKRIVQKRKEDCSRVQQLGVTCVAGYAAGAIGTVVSNPADNIVATLYNKKAENVLQVAPVNAFYGYMRVCIVKGINIQISFGIMSSGCEENWVR